MNYHHKKHKANDDNIEAAVADEEELNDIKPTPNRTASISSGVGDHIGGGGPSSQQRSKTTTSTTHHSSTTKHPTQTIEVVDKGKSSPTHGRQQRASSGTVQIHPSEHQSPRHSHLSHTTTTTSTTTTTTTTPAANNTTSSSTDQRNQQQRQDREDGEGGGEGSSSGHLVTVKISKL